MNKIFSLIISVVIFSQLGLNAAVYKGQALFVEKCTECHSCQPDFFAKRTVAEWKIIMQKQGKPLADIHLKSKKTKKSLKYFKSKKYYMKSRHLQQFLEEYAKDSGKVPACN